MKIFRKTAIAIILTALLAASALSGCGNGNNSSAASSSAASTSAAQPSSKTESDSSVKTTTEPTAEPATQPDESQDDEEKVDSQGYIDKSQAVAEVKTLAGSGAQILDCHQGISPDRAHAWVVTVAPITNSEEPKVDVYYSGYQFCYRAEDTQVSETESYIDKDEAISVLKSHEGSGATILDTHKGYSPTGEATWVVTATPVSASETFRIVTYYIGDGYTYTPNA